MAEILNSDEIEQIRQFCSLPVAEKLFVNLERGLFFDWANSTDPRAREHCWYMFQAMGLLKQQLQDAAKLKELDDRRAVQAIRRAAMQ